MVRRFVIAVLALLAGMATEGEPAVPPGCEVIRPVSEVDSLRGTISAMAQSARRRAVGVRSPLIDIDVMEIYGPQLLRDAGSAEAARTLVQHQIDTTNQALSDSGLGHVRLRLRHARFSRNYDRFPTGQPGPEIVEDRQYYGADLLGFIVGEMPFGFGAAACRPPSYDPGCGVHWVQAANLTDYPLAYVHEVGHNLGADHDAPNAMPRNVDPHPFARAHCVPGQWRTLMSYGNPCLANAVLLFSNPQRMSRGLSTGVPDEADNARVIDLSAPLVRDYFPATQNSGPRCEFRITFDDGDVPVGGATRTFVAERIRGTCQPDLGALDEWVRINITPGATAERIEAQVTYLPNDQPLSRRGHFVVGEQPVTIEQAAAAECLMGNGSFDEDVSGWTVRPFAIRQGVIAWSPRDVNDKPDSGSAMLTVTGGHFGVERCVAVEPASRYVLRSNVYMDAGQKIEATDAPAFQSVSLFDSTDCSGPDSGFGNSIQNIAETWLRIESPFTTQPNTRSAKISLNVNVAAGRFTTHFDDIHLCRVGSAAASTSETVDE